MHDLPAEIGLLGRLVDRPEEGQAVNKILIY